MLLPVKENTDAFSISLSLICITEVILYPFVLINPLIFFLKAELIICHDTHNIRYNLYIV